jgi:hypothetical protein
LTPYHFHQVIRETTAMGLIALVGLVCDQLETSSISTSNALGGQGNEEFE